MEALPVTLHTALHSLHSPDPLLSFSASSAIRNLVRASPTAPHVCAAVLATPVTPHAAAVLGACVGLCGRSSEEAGGVVGLPGPSQGGALETSGHTPAAEAGGFVGLLPHTSAREASAVSPRGHSTYGAVKLCGRSSAEDDLPGLSSDEEGEGGGVVVMRETEAACVSLIAAAVPALFTRATSNVDRHALVGLINKLFGLCTGYVLAGDVPPHASKASIAFICAAVGHFPGMLAALPAEGVFAATRPKTWKLMLRVVQLSGVHLAASSDTWLPRGDAASAVRIALCEVRGAAAEVAAALGRSALCTPGSQSVPGFHAFITTADGVPPEPGFTLDGPRGNLLSDVVSQRALLCLIHASVALLRAPKRADLPIDACASAWQEVQPSLTGALALPAVLSLCASHDPALVSVCAALLTLAEAVDGAPGHPLAPAVLAATPKLRPLGVFRQLLATISYDHTLLAGWITSDETQCLWYLSKALRSAASTWPALTTDVPEDTLDNVMSCLIRLRMSLVRTEAAGLLEFSVAPLVARLEHVEDLYDGTT